MTTARCSGHLDSFKLWEVVEGIKHILEGVGVKQILLRVVGSLVLIVLLLNVDFPFLHAAPVESFSSLTCILCWLRSELSAMVILFEVIAVGMEATGGKQTTFVDDSLDAIAEDWMLGKVIESKERVFFGEELQLLEQSEAECERGHCGWPNFETSVSPCRTRPFGSRE